MKYICAGCSGEKKSNKGTLCQRCSTKKNLSLSPRRVKRCSHEELRLSILEQRQYRKDHPEEWNAYMHSYYQNHKDDLKASCKIRYPEKFICVDCKGEKQSPTGPRCMSCAQTRRWAIQRAATPLTVTAATDKGIAWVKAA